MTIPVEPLTVIVEPNSGSMVDAQALLVSAAGRVRGDDDFVFFNAPQHRSGAVRVTTTQQRAVVEVDPRRVESAIDRIVVSVSVDHDIRARGTQFRVAIKGRGSELATYCDNWPTGITALMVGEFYRRGDAWKFRAVGQGWDTGLAGLAEHFGVAIDDPGPSHQPEPDRRRAAEHPRNPAPPTPPRGDARPANWYPDTQQPGLLRWWDSRGWTDRTRPNFSGQPSTCPRCGGELKDRLLGGTPICKQCRGPISQVMDEWVSRARDVLDAHGPHGPDWDDLWARLRFEMISEEVGYSALRKVALRYLERVVAFAFADGAIEQSELDHFTRAVAALHIPPGKQIDELCGRMQRGRMLTRLRDGDLPRATAHSVHLDSDELLHLQAPVRRVRQRANGPRVDEGQLLVTNKKLRFVGPTSGTEVAWSKVTSVSIERNSVIVAATTAAGGGVYTAHDPEYVAAVLEGTLRVSKRLVLVPGMRDTRSIPQHVRNAVWQRDGARCTQCGASEYLEFDHVIPFSRGGATSVNNLQILCRACNQAKGARL